MNRRVVLISIIWIMIIVSCDPVPVPIEYNVDECVYCKMKISDPQFGAELVNSKGKAYKYDSAECMFRDYLHDDEMTYPLALVTDYSDPGTLIDARDAYFLVSENQPSPMGGNLSAYLKEREALQAQKNKGGDVYSFEDMLSQYKKRIK